MGQIRSSMSSRCRNSRHHSQLIDEGGPRSMKQIRRHAAGMCALGALLVATLAIPGAQALDKPGTVTVTAIASRHTHVDVGAKGKSVGAIDQYSSLFYNKRIPPTPIGRGSMLCT